MRVSDTMMSDNYIGNINDIKSKIAQLQLQMMTGKKITKPSDSPVAASKLLRLSDQSGQVDTFLKNAKNGLSFLNSTTFALQSIQDETVNVITKLTDLQNPVNQGNLGLYADMIEQSLNLILDVSNSKAEGKYIFGGTDYSSNPYGYSLDNQSIIQKTNNSGNLNIRLSSSITQKINISGQEVFGTISSLAGTIDKNAAVGSIINNSLNIQDTLGNQYTLNTTLEKTADNTYNLTYDIVDSGGNSVYSTPPAARQVVFSPANGRIASIDGSTNPSFNVSVPDKQIYFALNLDSLSEKNVTATNLTANQQMDIFNLLKKISTDLRNGIVPSADQIAAVEAFNSRVVGKMSQIGNAINQITSTQNMLTQHNLNLQENMADINGVDQVKAIIDLQSQEYLLQLSQQIGAMILPKSLLDYL